MTPEQWTRVKDLFSAALHVPSERRGAFLDDTCGDDPAVRAEVERLLAQQERSGDFLDTPAAAPVTAVERTFVPGQTVAGRYRIERFIGAGGMGEVYEAEDLELHQRVALKTLLPELASDARMVERFKREVQLARTVAHPNVCHVYDLEGSSGTGGTIFLSMQFLRGETLAARLDRQGKMAPKEAWPLIDQMAQALDAASRAGVIHRDFKPSNVMLVTASDGPRAVVTDFGLARRAVTGDETTATISGNLMGTPDYMAPEVLAGGIASPASDLYALGLVTYKMVTGTLPVRGKALVPPSEMAPGLPRNWDRALARVLDANPAQRYPTAGDFVRALRGDTASVTVKLPVMTPRRWVATLTVLVALIAAAGVWSAWRRMRSMPSPEARAFYQKGIEDIHAGAFFAATQALKEALRITPEYALAHARLAESWNELQMPERAQEEMVRAEREDQTGLGEVDRLEVAAISLTITRDFDAALKKYQRMQQIAGADDAGVSVELARAYMRAGKPDPAIDLFRGAAEGPAHSPAAWLWLGTVYARRSDKAKSAAAFEQAERLYRIGSNLEGLIELSFQRGLAAYRAGKLDQSTTYYRSALETAHTTGNLQQEIRAKLQLSTNAYLTGDAAASAQYAREALESAQANQMEPLAISGLVNIANACAQKRDVACAEKNYQEALGLARRSGSGQLTAVSLISLSSLHCDNGNYDGCAAEAQQALTYYQANRFTDETIRALSLMGRADYHRGRDGPALDSFRRILDVAEKSQNNALQALAHENIGLVYSHQQRYPEALTEYRKNLELSTDPVGAGYARLQCGGMLWQLGNYSDAQAMFEQADSAAAKIPDLALKLTRSRANLALSRNDYGRAAALARSALAAGIASKVTAAELQVSLGAALAGTGHRDEGRRTLEDALAAAGSLGDPDLLLNVRLAILRTRVESGDRPGALAVFHDAEPALSGFPESRWRALALVSRVEPQYAAPARQAIDQLAGQWGAEAFRSYRERPDVASLSRPLFLSTHANH